MASTAASTVTAFNMHTDLVITAGAAGAVTLTAYDPNRNAFAVILTSATRLRLDATARNIAGLATSHAATSPTGARPGAGVVSPFNMHTDSKTHISSSGNAIVITGPGTDRSNMPVALKITIDGPALVALRGAHPGF